jgi:hypothetical protein
MDTIVDLKLLTSQNIEQSTCLMTKQY